MRGVLIRVMIVTGVMIVNRPLDFHRPIVAPAPGLVEDRGPSS